jgi:hypothetical protein
MKSYGTASGGTGGTLSALLDLRVADERAAERALAAAAGARRAAEEEEVKLAAALAAARADVAAARRDGVDVGGGERAADAQGRRRFWARLDARVGAAGEALARHRREALARAIDGEVTARAAHLRARQRREVVEKAIARRQAAARRLAERRAEAAMDDRYLRASTNSPTTGK